MHQRDDNFLEIGVDGVSQRLFIVVTSKDRSLVTTSEHFRKLPQKAGAFRLLVLALHESRVDHTSREHQLLRSLGFFIYLDA